MMKLCLCQTSVPPPPTPSPHPHPRGHEASLSFTTLVTFSKWWGMTDIRVGPQNRRCLGADSDAKMSISVIPNRVYILI